MIATTTGGNNSGPAQPTQLGGATGGSTATPAQTGPAGASLQQLLQQLQSMQQQQNPNAIQPSYVQTPTVSDPNATNPQYGVSQVLQGFAPQAAASTNALNNTLASMGVTGGGAVDAQTALQGQLASSLAPTLGSVYSQYAGNSLQQALANAGNSLQGGEFNSGAYNSLQDLLAQFKQQGYLSQLGGIQGLYNNQLGGAQGIAQQGAQNFPIQQNDLSGLGTALGSVQPAAAPSPSAANWAPGTSWSVGDVPG